ncbi:unnamed protein product, partial [Brassica oleracea]
KDLRGESSRNTGIPTAATLAELWDQGTWQLPPARSEGQVNIQTHLTTLALTHEADAFQWMPHGKHSTIYSTRKIYNLLLVLLAWQASIYCIWAERNARLHRSRFRPPSAIVKEIHTIVKLRIASIRIDDPHLASVLFQAWVS